MSSRLWWHCRRLLSKLGFDARALKWLRCTTKKAAVASAVAALVLLTLVASVKWRVVCTNFEVQSYIGEIQSCCERLF
jgi:hypothetical protein